MKRTTVREHVFRILFRYDFYDKEDFEAQARLYFDSYPDCPGESDDAVLTGKGITELDRAEIISRVCDVAAHIGQLDEAIDSVCDGWKLERIGKAELSILRLAAYEIICDGEIEAAIAINEAVELCKKYCDAKSHSFVNGVLAKLVK